MTERLRLELVDASGAARLSAATVERLLERLRTAATYVTIEGAGAVFCDGLDLEALAASRAAPDGALARFGALLHAIETAPRPVVALVGGAARGGGVGLAAAADLVLATPDATFSLPETLFGLIPATVLPIVARRIGAARARGLAVTARVAGADEALRIGLVDEVADDLEAALAVHARRLVRLDARAVAEAKAIAAALDAAPAGYDAAAAGRFAVLLESADTRARIDRFLAGDAPWPDGGRA